jgi:hypothetical protein
VSLIADTRGRPLPFGQLLLEVHIGWSEGKFLVPSNEQRSNGTGLEMTTIDQFSKWFARLERAGLRPFYFEVSMLDVNTLRAEPAVVYVSHTIKLSTSFSFCAT